MREFLKFFLGTIGWPVHLIGWGTFAVWVFKALVLDQYPGRWPLYDFGRVMEGIFSALISGYVFYILFALWPEYKARKLLSSFFAVNIASVVGDCMGILLEVNFAAKSGCTIDGIDEAAVVKAFGAIGLKSPTRLTKLFNNQFVQANWFDVFNQRMERTRCSVARLFAQGRFLDPEVIVLLTKIVDCSFFLATEHAAGLPLTNPDLSPWAQQFVKYMRDCRQLAVWYDKQMYPGRGRLLQ